MASSDVWTADQARRYDSEDGMSDPEVLEHTVDTLAELAGGGPALELAIGTGRVGVPLRAKGVPSPASSCPSRWSRSSGRR